MHILVWSDTVSDTNRIQEQRAQNTEDEGLALVKAPTLKTTKGQWKDNIMMK